jgi:hypothetical protein
MAKKSKKRKRRRHQMKKSRQGQTRKRRARSGGGLPLEFDYDDDLGGPDIAIMRSSGSDVPLVEDGYRIVGPAQAMVDYAKPLMDEAESRRICTRHLSLLRYYGTLLCSDAVIQRSLRSKRRNWPTVWISQKLIV